MPRYPVVGGEIGRGYQHLVAELARARPRTVAVDGPGALDWERFGAELERTAHGTDLVVRTIDVRERMRPWSEILERTESEVLRDDPVFATLYPGPISDFFPATPDLTSVHDQHDRADVTVVYGPGSALATPDLLWYADLPKALGLDAIDGGRARNLGQPRNASGRARRLMFIDWPVEDRHRRALARSWSRYIDLSSPDEPRSLDADSLRRTLAYVSEGPFRTRPRFLAQPWGGRWLRESLSAHDVPNGGLGYELIAPEAGLLVGTDAPMEVALEVLLALDRGVLGPRVVARFGDSFPIRFDYLDTIGGGDLSVHCHPRTDYMRSVFGLPYTQHETYYVMVTRPGARIFLGLRADADPDTFRAAAEMSQRTGSGLAVERFVNTVDASRHQLYLIPGGTPHGSGEGNVVLEISATPYLYSLRFYDWMREDLGGGFRAVQLDHAFANLDPRRNGASLAELVPAPKEVRTAPGGVEYDLGRHPDLFFAVRRLDLATEMQEDTDRRFHVLNLVEGEEVLVRTASGREHTLAYAETMVVPAHIGPYRIVGTGGAKVVKAFVA